MFNFNNKYSNFLTMLLIVLIVAILGIVGYFAYDMYNQNDKNSKAQSAIEKFNKSTQSVKKVIENKTENAVTNVAATDNKVKNPLEELNTVASQANTVEGNTTAQEIKKTYLEDYEILGTINIPKTKCNYPILNEVTKRSIEIAVAVLYPPKLEALNMPGNTVIAGHNYRNNLFFSNNKKLEIGDEIIIESTTEKVTYEIYDIFETTPNDADYMIRDTEGKREISLSTCTDDSSGRLIILAREK